MKTRYTNTDEAICMPCIHRFKGSDSIIRRVRHLAAGGLCPWRCLHGTDQAMLVVRGEGGLARATRRGVFNLASVFTTTRDSWDFSLGKGGGVHVHLI